MFTEPNLAFSLAERSGDSVTIRVHLPLESGPPSDEIEVFDYFVPLGLTSAALAAAIDDWGSALRRFPVR